MIHAQELQEDPNLADMSPNCEHCETLDLLWQSKTKLSWARL